MLSSAGLRLTLHSLLQDRHKLRAILCSSEKNFALSAAGLKQAPGYPLQDWDKFCAVPCSTKTYSALFVAGPNQTLRYLQQEWDKLCAAHCCTETYCTLHNMLRDWDKLSAVHCGTETNSALYTIALTVDHRIQVQWCVNKKMENSGIIPGWRTHYVRFRNDLPLSSRQAGRCVEICLQPPFHFTTLQCHAKIISV